MMNNSLLQIQTMCAVMLLPIIFIVSCLLSTPVFLKSKLLSLDQLLGREFPLAKDEKKDMMKIKVCVEDWTDGRDRTIKKHQRLRQVV